MGIFKHDIFKNGKQIGKNSQGFWKVMNLFELKKGYIKDAWWFSDFCYMTK